MRRTKRIPAFTLNEMMVVLLLTSLVVGMAFAVLQLVQKQMRGIDNNYDNRTELNLLRQSLWLDFNQHDGAWFDQKESVLVFANGLNEVSYQLDEDKIIKGIDTFEVALQTKAFFFKGIAQSSGEIDALDFTTAKANGAQRFFVSKKNAATSYMNE